MTNADLARAFADNHGHLEFDAVLIDVTVAGGRLYGSIYFDKARRFPDGHSIHTGTIVGNVAAGRVIGTKRTRYLVQMAPETELARREASLEVAS